MGEKLCDALGQRSDTQIASFRFSGIYTEEHRRLLAQRSESPLIRGTGALWSYIDVRDAARACRLGLEANFSGHESFNICAPDTIMKTPTTELAEKYLPLVSILPRNLHGRSSGYDTRKAETLLKFRAQLLLHN